MQNSMVMFNFSVFDQKLFFFDKFHKKKKKIKIVNLACLIPGLILFCFRLEILFMGKFDPNKTKLSV